MSVSAHSLLDQAPRHWQHWHYQMAPVNIQRTVSNIVEYFNISVPVVLTGPVGPGLVQISVIICQLTIRNIYLQTAIIDYAQRTSRSENPFLIVLKLSSNDPLYGLVINLALARWVEVLSRHWTQKRREASYWSTACAWLYHEKYESIKTIYKWFLIFITPLLSEMLQFKLTNIPRAISANSRPLSSVDGCCKLFWNHEAKGCKFLIPLHSPTHNLTLWSLDLIPRLNIKERTIKSDRSDIMTRL